MLVYFILFIILLILSICCIVYWITENETTIHQIVYPSYYRSKFDEQSFPPLVNETKYHSRVVEGYKIMSKSKISVLGLAYNLGEKTHKLMKKIFHITSKFKSYQIIIYSIDSTDNTYNILQKYAENNSNIILPTETINKKKINRVSKMSKLRNILRKHCIQSDFNPDFVLMQDCDLASPLSIDGIANSLSYMKDNKYKKKYDAVFANGLANEFLFNIHFPFIGFFYYDTFAFLEDPKNPIDEYGLGFINKPTRNIISICKSRGESPISVKSAFGGAAIYNYDVFNKFKYKEKTKICEHVTLNKKIYKSGYRLAMNPSLLVFAGRQGENYHKTSLMKNKRKKKNI